MDHLAPLAYPSALGETVPAFSDLLGTDGKRYPLASFGDRRILVVVFMANRCPTARVYTDRMKALQGDFGPSGVQLIAVNSDDPHLFSQESLDEMARIANERGFTFPYLKDADQSAGRAFGARVTLHAFVLDGSRRMRYRGRMDDSRDPARVTRNDLWDALEDILAGREVRVAETRPFACAIEYI